MGRRTEKNKQVAGWCYLWDVARLNGVAYIDGDEKQHEFLMKLVSKCASRPAEDEVLAEAGHRQYHYGKKYEESKTQKHGRGVAIKASGKLEDEGKTGEEVWEQAQSMLGAGGSGGEPSTKRARKPKKQEDDKKEETDQEKKWKKWCKDAPKALVNFHCDLETITAQYQAKKGLRVFQELGAEQAAENNVQVR